MGEFCRGYPTRTVRCAVFSGGYDQCEVWRDGFDGSKADRGAENAGSQKDVLHLNRLLCLNQVSRKSIPVTDRSIEWELSQINHRQVFPYNSSSSRMAISYARIVS